MLLAEGAREGCRRRGIGKQAVPAIDAEAQSNSKSDQCGLALPNDPDHEETIILPQPGGGEEKEAFMQMLIITVCILVAIWIIILFGARFFGPR
jgi:hypothetical protein